MRLGIYVGSFNPPQEGHHKVMTYVLEKNLVDQVLLLPTPNYWDKNDLVDVDKRIEMLKFYEDDRIKVDEVHNVYTYTYEVLRSLKKDYPEDELYLIMGSDNLPKFHQWKNVEEILQNKVIVLKREKIEKNPNLKAYEKQFIYCEDFEFIDISSTEIRNGDRKFIHPGIKKYIEEHHLYENV